MMNADPTPDSVATLAAPTPSSPAVRSEAASARGATEGVLAMAIGGLAQCIRRSETVAGALVQPIAFFAGRGAFEAPATGVPTLDTGDQPLNTRVGAQNTGVLELNTGGERRNTSDHELNTSGERRNTSDQELNTSDQLLNTTGERRNTRGERLITGDRELNTGGERRNTGGRRLNTSGRDLEPWRATAGEIERTSRIHKDSSAEGRHFGGPLFQRRSS